jgi:uncharacterized protein (TIGR02118 family)
MVKLICLIHRPEGQSKEGFQRWWLDHHARVAAALPGLRRYTISTTPLDREGESAPFDGVAELWFDSEDAMEAAFASEQGQACAREDRELIGRRIAFLTQEHVIIGHASHG